MQKLLEEQSKALQTQTTFQQEASAKLHKDVMNGITASRAIDERSIAKIVTESISKATSLQHEDKNSTVHAELAEARLQAQKAQETLRKLERTLEETRVRGELKIAEANIKSMKKEMALRLEHEAARLAEVQRVSSNHEMQVDHNK